ncbi:MAG: hypothetical protein WBO23_17055 [Burkholderiales bacterium]
MSEPDDLLGKADAFLKRYHPSSPSARDDVPVLTEVVADPAAHSTPPSAKSFPAGAELQELEQRLKQSVLDAIGPHVAKILEEPLQARFEAHLQRALATFTAQIKLDIEKIIREAVARAVELEVARFRGPSRGP